MTRYEVSLRIQSECGKYGPEINSVFGHFPRNGSWILLIKIPTSIWPVAGFRLFVEIEIKTQGGAKLSNSEKDSLQKDLQILLEYNIPETINLH